ncbi:ninja-family protein [Musa troglodytarum]|uniref:Ninja-family protein n=1 Tax=Musa troglodytarum TaxID=320322 RepID=A0A9E7JRP9_9LILI|nr:ninja-family protein [Musa troglodytarum]
MESMGAADDGDEVELTLGLAIGGSTPKAPKPRRTDSAGKRWRMPEDGMIVGTVESQMVQSRAPNRAVRDGDAFSGDQCKSVGTALRNATRRPCVAPNPNPNPNPNPSSLGHRPVPVMHPCHQVQYVGVPNGLGLPCLMPYWAPTISAATGGFHGFERNACRPAACRGVAVHAATTCPSDGGWEVGNLAPKMDSTGSNSSGVDDRRSRLIRGGSSVSSGCSKCKSSTQKAAKPASSSVSNAGEVLRRAVSLTTPVAVAREWKTGIAADDSSPLLGMPRVSTTGDGPSGRTISGYLYRYDKSAVSIMCACHGKSFTPAEFVRHAGGSNASDPLRQIVVVPS